MRDRIIDLPSEHETKCEATPCPSCGGRMVCRIGDPPGKCFLCVDADKGIFAYALRANKVGDQ